jgi:hypothetical protein
MMIASLEKPPAKAAGKAINKVNADSGRPLL